jgi:four helix bundle protein
MKKSHNFRELKIWQDSMSLVKVVYDITSKLPMEERFGFISQLNRCSVSIPSNIAEGSGRSSEKEFVRFLEIAISSSYELETQLILINVIFGLEVKNVLEDLTNLQIKIGAFKRRINNDRIENKS